jgi:hypothetical protein
VEGDTVTIIHRSFEYLNALTLGMDPAYRQTSVNVREVKEEMTENTEEDKEKRACGSDNKEDRGCGGGKDDENRDNDKEKDKPLESDNPDDLEEMEQEEREQRAIAAYNRRKREIEMFDIENNY